MKLNVVSEKKDELEIELVGEDHTFCNSLRKALTANKDVLTATYKVEHPLLTPPKLFIRTKDISLPKMPQRIVPISEVKGVAEKREKALRKAGIKTANALAKADAEKIAKKTDITVAVAQELINEAAQINFFKGSVARELLKKSLKDMAKNFTGIKLKGA